MQKTYSCPTGNAHAFRSLHLVAPEFRQAASHLHVNIRTKEDEAVFGHAVMAQLDIIPVARQPEKISLPGNREVNLYIYHSENPHDDNAVIYFIHGGSFIFGFATQNNAILYQPANQTGTVVVSVAYRLAPEYPFPMGINDVYEGLSFLRDNDKKIGVNAENLIIMGESSGGDIAASLALILREREEQRAAELLLISPMLDYLTGTADSPYQNTYSGEFLCTPVNNQYFWNALLSDRTISEQEMPYFSPAAATNLTGLPHTFMMVGSLDLFVDEDIDYANRFNRLLRTVSHFRIHKA